MLDSRRQLDHQRVDADVKTDAYAITNADKDHDGEEQRRQLQRPGKAGVEDITQHHLQEREAGHQHQHHGDNPFLEMIEQLHMGFLETGFKALKKPWQKGFLNH
jgi:hypothetical protein